MGQQEQKQEAQANTPGAKKSKFAKWLTNSGTYDEMKLELAFCQNWVNDQMEGWEFPDKSAKITKVKDFAGEMFLVHNRRGVTTGYQLNKMTCLYQGLGEN